MGLVLRKRNGTEKNTLLLLFTVFPAFANELQFLQYAKVQYFFPGTLSIQVQDIDDNPPAFSHTRFNASVDENSPSGTPLRFGLQMSLSDPDKVFRDGFEFCFFSFFFLFFLHRHRE